MTRAAAAARNAARTAAASGRPDLYLVKPCAAGCSTSVRWVDSYAGKPIPLAIERRPDGPVVLDHDPKTDRYAARAFQPGRDVADRPRYAVHWTACRLPSIYAAVRAAADPRGELPPIKRGGGTAGPCSACGAPNERRYGPGGNPLCPDCLRGAVGRWSPAFRRAMDVSD